MRKEIYFETGNIWNMNVIFSLHMHVARPLETLKKSKYKILMRTRAQFRGVDENKNPHLIHLVKDCMHQSEKKKKLQFQP